jgi:hypothetical protein
MVSSTADASAAYKVLQTQDFGRQFGRARSPTFQFIDHLMRPGEVDASQLPRRKAPPLRRLQPAYQFLRKPKATHCRGLPPTIA